MLTAIRQWVIKTMMKGQTGVVQTLPKKEIIEMNTQITAERIMRNGINPQDLKSVGQVENVINQIETPKVIAANSAEGKGITEKLFGKKADVLDMEGNKINTSKGIMGGKEINQKILNEELMKTDNPYSDLVNTPRPKTIAEREADVLAGMEKNNKEMVQRIRERKSLVDDSIVKIKSMEPMEAMKEANKVAGKQGVYKSLNDDQINKIIDDTNDHIFQRDVVPDEFDPEYATGGRVGLKSGLSKAFLEFLKKTGKNINNKSPIDAGKDYFKYIKDESIKGNSKKIAPGVLTIGAGGILANRFVGRRLEEMNKKQKIEMYEDTKKEFIEEYKNDPKLLEIMLKNLDDKTFGKLEEKADGGRIGLAGGTNEDFQKYLKERERFQKERSLEQLYKEYQEDLRRQEVGEQKQMAADGGRIGLKAGMTKRAFLKLMGAGAAGIGAAKSGLFSFGKGATKEVAKEVAQQTTSGTPPAYFFKLAEKIKKMGDDVTSVVAYKDTQKVTKFKDYELTEDLATGEQTIQRYKTLDDADAADYYGQPLTEETYMSYKPGKGQMDETMKGKTPPDEYEEGTAYIRNDKQYVGEVVDEASGVSDDIFKEVGEEVPEAIRKEKASGGLAYMLGE